MSEQNFPDNVLYNMDNLDVLRGINSETVDLIPTDPPFNKKRNRAGTAGQYEDAWRWATDQYFTTTNPDQWKWVPVHSIWLDEIKDENPALAAVIEATRLTQDDDTAAFLCFLGVRLIHCHRILKPTGSLYLHCDHSANGYIRMLLDAIFGKDNFRNEIIWHYAKGHGPKNDFRRKHDTIFRYTKTNQFTFNKQFYPHLESQLYRFNKIDEVGRAYRINHVKDKEGNYKRFYLDEGVACDDVWSYIRESNFDQLAQNSRERTGSPDQKPESVLERIILTSSNEGDLILDPFAGCITSLIVADRLKRRYVGIDRRTDLKEHVVARKLGMRTVDLQKQLSGENGLLPESVKYLNDQINEHGIHFLYKAPIRTDNSEMGPDLKIVYTTIKEQVKLTHAEMRDILAAKFGLQCWGCDFIASDIRYLELDHIAPKSEGGSHQLENRSLLCGPCNKEKKNNSTLNGLRNSNRKSKYLTAKQHPIDIKQAVEWGKISRPRYEQMKEKLNEQKQQLHKVQLNFKQKESIIITMPDGSEKDELELANYRDKQKLDKIESDLMHSEANFSRLCV